MLLLTGHDCLGTAPAALDRGIFAYLLKDAARIGVLEHRAGRSGGAPPPPARGRNA